MASAGRSFSTAVTEQLQLLPLFFKVPALICCILVIFDGKSDATYKPKLQGHSYLRKKPIMASENMHTDEAQMFSYANVRLQLVNLVY